MELIIRGWLQCLLWLSCCVDGFSFQLHEGIVLPRDPFVFIGDNLTLTCKLIGKDGDSASMYFTKREKNCSEMCTFPQKYIEIVNLSTIKLHYPVRYGKDRGMYNCYTTETQNYSAVFLGWQYVMVDYRPKAVEKLDCHVFNWETMKCSWDLGVNYINQNNIKVSLKWAIALWHDCPNSTTTSCTWMNDHRDAFQIFKPDFTYHMKVNVTVLNQNQEVVGVAQSNQFTIHTAKLVQPARVENIKIERKNSTCTTLKWSHRKVRHKKVYHVHYHSQWDRASDWTGILNLTKENVTICNLTPATNYIFRVTCEPILKGFLSEWENITAVTDEDVPGTSPNVTSGSYMQWNCNAFDGCRFVQIYWQPVDGFYSHGHIVGYHVEYKNLQTSKKETEVASAGNNSVALRLQWEESYIVQLRAGTNKGLSSNYSVLKIPNINTKPAYPEKFLVEAVKPLAIHEFHLKWREPVPTLDGENYKSNVTGYTVYWCKRKKVTLSFECKDYISWKNLPPNQFRFKINSTMQTSMDTDQFGISADSVDSDGQPISSGISWSHCTYIKDDRPSLPPKNVHFSAYQPEGTLKIEWDHFSCQESHGYVTHYNLLYCVGDEDRCTGALINETIGNNHRSHVIKALEPDVVYRVMLQAVSESGPGPTSKPIVKKVIESKASFPSGAIVGISMGGTIVVIFCVLMFRNRKEIKQSIFLKINFPRSFYSLDSGESPDSKYQHIPSRDSQTSDARDSKPFSDSSEMVLIGHKKDKIPKYEYEVSNPWEWRKDELSPLFQVIIPREEFECKPEHKNEKSPESCTQVVPVKKPGQGDHSVASYSKVNVFGNSAGDGHHEYAKCNEKSVDSHCSPQPLFPTVSHNTSSLGSDNSKDKNLNSVGTSGTPSSEVSSGSQVTSVSTSGTPFSEVGSYSQVTSVGTSGTPSSEVSSYSQVTSVGTSGTPSSEVSSYSQVTSVGTSGLPSSELSSCSQVTSVGTSGTPFSEVGSYSQVTSVGTSGTPSSVSSYSQVTSVGTSGTPSSEVSSYSQVTSVDTSGTSSSEVSSYSQINNMGRLGISPTETDSCSQITSVDMSGTSTLESASYSNVTSVETTGTSTLEANSSSQISNLGLPGTFTPQESSEIHIFCPETSTLQTSSEMQITSSETTAPQARTHIQDNHPPTSTQEVNCSNHVSTGGTLTSPVNLEYVSLDNFGLTKL